MTDYIAGMTDRFCIRRVRAPRGARERVLAALEPRSPTSRSSASARPPTSSRSSPRTPTCAAPARADRACARSTTSARRRSRSTRARSSTTASAAGRAATSFEFVEEKEGLEFPEAVEPLADRYGVELEREDEDPRARRAAAAPRAAARAARADRRPSTRATCGSRRGGEGARATSPSAGSARRRCEAFGVGYAPSAWDRVLLRGQQAGFSGRGAARGGAGAAGPERRRLRPLPRADHVPSAPGA